MALAWRFLWNAPDAAPAPAVILQPILSGDPDLHGALAANLAHAPTAQFIWLVDEDDIEGQRIARDLCNANTVISLQPPPQDGENPKLKKLIAGAPQSGATLVVLDDDTVLKPGGAARLAGRAEAARGLATAIPVWGRTPRNAAEALVAGFINGQGISTYFAMSALGRNKTINGMAYAIPADILATLGGFSAAGHEVTDDWAVARLVRSGGYLLVQTVEPAEVATSLTGLVDALHLLRRWMLFAHRYMAANADGALLALVVLPGLLPFFGIVLSLAIWPAFAVVWLCVLAVRAGLHHRLVTAVAGPQVKATILATVAAELLLPFLSLAALWRRNRLRWRSRNMELRDGLIRFR